MTRLKTFVAAIALLAPAAAVAAEDPGLTLHETYPSARRLGAGAQVKLSIPLGRSARSDPTDGPTLSLRAGPSLTTSGAAVRTPVAPLAELAIRPAHSTRWSLAGQRLAVSYAQPALREADAAPEGPRSNISTIGWVAIGVGAAVIVGGLLFIDAVNDASE